MSKVENQNDCVNLYENQSAEGFFTADLNNRLHVKLCPVKKSTLFLDIDFSIV
ncbi:MAG: hypothetical protein NWQ54_23415 [Paraglaciecola sp.]|nr:hypothetical protein [Paraglaciecola sp.]